MTADLKEVVQRVETQVQGIVDNQSKKEEKLKQIDSKIEKQIQDTTKLRDETDREINNTKKSLDKECKSTKLKLIDVEKKLNELKAMYDKKKNMKRKSIDQEARSRVNSLLLFGITESKDEKCDLSLSKFFKDQLGISQPIIAQRAHRLGKPTGRDTIGNNVKGLDL